MPLKRSEKEAFVADMVERLKGAEAIVITDFRGLNVSQLSELRRRLRECGAQYRVVKNTLTLRAFDEAGVTAPTEMLDGPIALAFLHADLAGPAKALIDFAKETDVLKVKGGLMGGQVIDLATVKVLAELPSRDELLASFIGVLQAPLRQYVSVVSAPLRDFVGVMRARAEAGAES